jgi:ABC-type Na+ efflux pump permease subunit
MAVTGVPSGTAPTASRYTPPRMLTTAWLIARRGALESLRDRSTMMSSTVFALVIPAVLAVLVVRPQLAHVASGKAAAVGTSMAAYLLIVGLLPSSGSIGIAAGVFAGEKEQGNLAPLLATPASNGAIFAGKVLGAVLPSLLYAVVAEVVYLGGVALLSGVDRLRLLPPALSLAMVAFVPVVAVMGAAVASVISSRVRTYNGAQVLTSLVLLPIMGGLFGLAFEMRQWGPLTLFAVVAALALLDAALIALGAATWRREEVMARQ